MDQQPASVPNPAPDKDALREAGNLCRLDPAALHFRRHGAVLSLSVDGTPAPYEKVTIVRMFPLSQPDQYWSVRNETNEEVGVILDPRLLPPEQQALLAAEMRRRYVMPVILAVLAMNERFDTLDWFVETDRGGCRFTTRQLRDNLLRPTPNRYIITDVDGNRFDIPDVSSLPLASQALLSRHL